jgi:hypothetical protein
MSIFNLGVNYTEYSGVQNQVYHRTLSLSFQTPSSNHASLILTTIMTSTCEGQAEHRVIRLHDGYIPASGEWLPSPTVAQPDGHKARTELTIG